MSVQRNVKSPEQKAREKNAALRYEQSEIKKADFDALVVDLGGE